MNNNLFSCFFGWTILKDILYAFSVWSQGPNYPHLSPWWSFSSLLSSDIHSSTLELPSKCHSKITQILLSEELKQKHNQVSYRYCYTKFISKKKKFILSSHRQHKKDSSFLCTITFSLVTVETLVTVCHPKSAYSSIHADISSCPIKDTLHSSELFWLLSPSKFPKPVSLVLQTFFV